MPEPPHHGAGEDPLGPLLCRRGPQSSYIVLLVVFLFFSLALPGAAALMLIPPSPASTRAIDLGVLLPLGLVGLLGSMICIRELRTRVSFHQHGCTLHRGRHRREIRYAQAQSFRFRVARQHALFVHVSSTFAMELRGPGRVRIRCNGTLREKARGFLSLARDCTDDLILVRAIIAARMGETMADAILSGSVVPWGDAAMLTAEGLTPTRGRLKGSLLPYSAITREGLNDDQFALFLDDDDRPIAVFSMNAVNFAPCCAAFHALQERALRGDGPWVRLCMPVAGALPSQMEIARANELADRLDILLRDDGRGMVARIVIAENPDRQEIRFVILCGELADVTISLERLLDWAALPEGSVLLVAPDERTGPERIDLA
ncbi:MAG: hypothetical protein KF699_08960 [Phycisphaeraceae bacterium]|nr:hypothetical protein [Phycisphaeraceae bacterium]